MTRLARRSLTRTPLPRSRAGRAVAAVGTAVVTMSGGHLLATDALPPLAGLLLAVVLMAAPAWWLTRDERGWERLAAAQLVAQLGGHALFVVTAADPMMHAGHGVLGPEIALLAHVASAAVAGAWLRCGERRAIAAARRAAEVLRRLVSRLLGEWRRTGRQVSRRPLRAPVSRVLVALLRHSIVHRGPPAVC